VSAEVNGSSKYVTARVRVGERVPPESMSHKTRGRIRMLLAVPSAAVLMLSASRLLASPPAAARAPDCDTYCWNNWQVCEANPTYGACRYCGC